MPQGKHTVEVIKPDLEIEEKLALHEKGWIIRDIGMFLIVSIMTAGALGLFGDGFLSKKTAGAGNIEVKHERFYRYEAEMELTVTSGSPISTVAMPQQYLKNFIVRMVPEPDNLETTAEDVVYNFPKRDTRQVTFYLKPQQCGSLSGSLKVNGSTAFPLTHFIYP